MSNDNKRNVAQSLWSLLHDGEFDALKATCPETFSWKGTHDWQGKTPLQKLIDMSMPRGKGEPTVSAERIRDIAYWLMQRGADPHEKAAANACERNCWGGPEDDDDIGGVLPIKNNTAISSLISLRRSLRVTDEKEDEEEDWDWGEERDALGKLLQVFVGGAAQAIESEKVPIDSRMLDFWDSLRGDKATYDVLLEMADGQTGAHRVVLSAASEVLRRMLSSGMIEGQQQRIACSDSSEGAMSLLLDFMYTGSTTRAITLESGLGAFDLAHVWEVRHVLPMAERLLVSMLGADAFERIGELAVLKGSRSFEVAVGKWGSASQEVQSKLKAGGFSPALRRLLGEKEDEPAASRKRKSF